MTWETKEGRFVFGGEGWGALFLGRFARAVDPEKEEKIFFGKKRGHLRKRLAERPGNLESGIGGAVADQTIPSFYKISAGFRSRKYTLISFFLEKIKLIINKEFFSLFREPKRKKRNQKKKKGKGWERDP